MEMEEVGMNTVIASLNSSLSADTLWGVFGQFVPIISTTTLVALGFFLIRRALKRVSKMRAGA